MPGHPVLIMIIDQYKNNKKNKASCVDASRSSVFIHKCVMQQNANQLKFTDLLLHSNEMLINLGHQWTSILTHYITCSKLASLKADMMRYN